MRLLAYATLCVICCIGCDSAPAEKAAPAPPPSHARDKPAFVKGQLPVAPFVAEAQLELPGTRTLVYVGASWCEPCMRFHRALEAGELDEPLRGLRFVEYDSDQAKAALAADGYSSRLIPLFAIPEADGRCSPRKLEGSIKSESAVQQNILPRLQALLASGG